MLALLEPPLLARSLRNTLFDTYQRLLPRERQFHGAVIVEIDEASLRARGQWPWPRAVMAELIESIARARPVAIGVDVIFSEPERTPDGGDRALAKAIKSSGTVVLGVAGIGEIDPRFPSPPRAVPVYGADTREMPFPRFSGHLQSLEAFDEEAAGHGLLNADAKDPVIRKLPLIARVGNVLVPALSIEMLRVAQRVKTLHVAGRGDEEVTLRAGNVEVPIQSDGSFWIHYSHRYTDRIVSANEVLSGDAAEKLTDKFVLVGVTGLGLLELKASPLGEPIPGVEVHAQILEQIFEKRFLHRPTGARWFEAALLAVAGFVLLAGVPRMRSWFISLLPVAVFLLLGTCGLLAFDSGWLLDIATPGLGVLAVFVTVLASTLAETERQRKLLREAQAKVEAEMLVAQRIQTGLLPDPRKLFAYDPRFRIEAHLDPARTVGGDFYDCFMADPRRLFFVVADVSGKGVPASLFMALSKSLLKSVTLRMKENPGAILSQANVEIARDNPEGLFVTTFAGILDVETGEFSYCNAGHEPPILRRTDGTFERIEHAGGPPLCVMEDFEYPTEHRTLQAGEWLCIFTDGVTEAANQRDVLYGLNRLKTVLASEPETASPAALVAAIRDDVKRFAGAAEQSDDITILCVRWVGPSASPEATGSGAT